MMEFPPCFFSGRKLLIGHGQLHSTFAAGLALKPSTSAWANLSASECQKKSPAMPDSGTVQEWRFCQPAAAKKMLVQCTTTTAQLNCFATEQNPRDECQQVWTGLAITGHSQVLENDLNWMVFRLTIHQQSKNQQSNRSTTNHQQASTINNQPSTINNQQPTINNRWQILPILFSVLSPTPSTILPQRPSRAKSWPNRAPAGA